MEFLPGKYFRNLTEPHGLCNDGWGGNFKVIVKLN
jgi:hypothetical protein